MSDEHLKAARPQNQTSVFVKRKRTFTLVFLIILVVYIISAVTTDFNAFEGLASFPKAVAWIVKNLAPNEASWRWSSTILKSLVETALLSVAVTVCAGICAFPFSLLGTQTTKNNPWIGRAVRMVAAFFRNIPDVVWAMLLLFSFRQNILTGFFALFFTTFGLLTRTFIETIDEISASCVEALHATGTAYLQTVFRGIIPSSMAALISWVLYMVEVNIRNAVLIGMLTGTGIGFWFDYFYNTRNWGAAGLAVIAIVVLVIAIETTSTQVRKVIL